MIFGCWPDGLLRRLIAETRLQTHAREQGTDLQRLRRQVAFDRFLARMFSKGTKATYPWVLKGGYAIGRREIDRMPDDKLQRSLRDLAGQAFVEGKLEAPKHLARTVHDLYFEPRYEEFRPRTMWSLSNAFTSAFKELDSIPQFKATAKLGEFLETRPYNRSSRGGGVGPPCSL